MKRALAVTIIFMLILTTLAGTLLIGFGTANPSPTTSTISVISPQKNKVYTVNNVPLTLSNSITHAGTFGIGKQLIKYYLDGELKGQIESKLTRDSPTETFSFNLTGLSDGLHCVTVSVQGGYSYSFFDSSFDIVYFTVDTTPPRISIWAPLPRTYNATDIPLNFIVNEPVSWMGYSLDSQANVTIIENTTLSGLSYGSHNLTVYAMDTAGNTGISDTIYFTILVPSDPTPQSEPFPTWIVAAIVIIAVVAGALLVYFVKIKKNKRELGELHP